MFTPKEQEVYDLIVKKGIIKRKDLAKQLKLSEATINSHITNLLLKTETTSKAEMIINFMQGKTMTKKYITVPIFNWYETLNLYDNTYSLSYGFAERKFKQILNTIDEVNNNEKSNRFDIH